MRVDCHVFHFKTANGKLEDYNRRGKVFGEFDPNTGKQTTPKYTRGKNGATTNRFSPGAD